jgi:hypothetical protein
MPRVVTVAVIAVCGGLLGCGLYGMFAVSPWGTVIIIAGVIAVWMLLWMACRAADEGDLPRPPRTPKDSLYRIREQSQADHIDRVLDAAERRQKERV